MLVTTPLQASTQSLPTGAQVAVTPDRAPVARRSRRRGTTAVEYCVLLSFITIMITLAVQQLGSEAANSFNATSLAFNSSTNATSGSSASSGSSSSSASAASSTSSGNSGSGDSGLPNGLTDEYGQGNNGNELPPGQTNDSGSGNN
jgi:Flp pilus assembly pilin Flp